MWILTKLVLPPAVALVMFQNTSAGLSDKVSATPSESKSSTDTAPRPVITLHGICDDGKTKNVADSAACTTIVTREQFESLIKALSPNGQPLPANARMQLAKTYAESLAVEAAARKAGLVDTPEFREFMKWTLARSATDLFRQNLQEKYKTPPPEEIDAYYRQHLTDYERVRLIRVLVPRENPSAADREEFDRKAHQAANTARESLLKGADPVQVQKDAYTALGLASPPPTDLGNRRRADLLPEEAADVFGLKAGELTQVEVEPANYVIYKVAGRDAQSKDEVKTNISRAIFQQKFRETMKSILDAAPAEFDKQYLEPDQPAIETNRKGQPER